MKTSKNLLSQKFSIVIPAEAGIQTKSTGSPFFKGMTQTYARIA
ncbi:hypothetical protein CANDROIZ_230014 [Candidatus Roizmanbacteria bacterium]|nr:hypothetical protein CANDROIZ_230014 [Candidatus Roizmanbacteria bacterium]